MSTRLSLRFRVPRSLALVVVLAGCSISFEPRRIAEADADRLHDADDVEATPEQIRLVLRSLVDPMCGEVEQAADAVLARSEDPAVRRAALEWKAEAVPGLREALFQPRPVVALFDTWAYAVQMEDYFSTGPGAVAFGEQRTVGIATARRLERRIHDAAASFTTSGKVDDARLAVRSWATAHPVRGALAHRESATGLAGEIDLGLGISAGEAIGTLAVTADDLNRKLEIYTGQLPRQGRWEAELLAMDLAGEADLSMLPVLGERAVGSVERLEDSFRQIDGSVGQAVGAVDRIVPLLERLTATAESAPELVARERAVTIDAVRAEMNRTIEFAREERAVALGFISRERAAALDDLHQSIIEEREILTRDMEAISTRAIDHAFLRAAQLVAAIAVGMVIAGLASLLVVRRMIPGLVREWRAASTGAGS